MNPDYPHIQKPLDRITHISAALLRREFGDLDSLQPGAPSRGRVWVMNPVRSVGLAVAAVVLFGCSSNGSASAIEYERVDYVMAETPGAVSSTLGSDSSTNDRDAPVEVLSFDRAPFEATAWPVVIEDKAGARWDVGIDATAIVERGSARCAVVFYHYEAVDPNGWRPPPTGLDVDGQRITSTAACDALVMDAGLPHPGTGFALNDWVIVFEGFLIGANAVVEGFAVDGETFDIS